MFDSINNSGVCLITIKPIRFDLCHICTKPVWLAALVGMLGCNISYFQTFTFSVLGKIYCKKSVAPMSLWSLHREPNFTRRG